MKKALCIIAMVVLVLFALTLDSTQNILSAIRIALAPLFLGIFFALLLKAPISFLEKTLFASERWGRAKRPLSIAITLVVTVGVFALVGYFIVPELSKSLVAIKNGVEWLLSGGFGEKLKIGKRGEEWLKKGLERGLGELDKLIPDMVNLVGDTLRGVLNGLLGLMLGITMLASGRANSKLLAKVGGCVFRDRDMDFIRGTLSALVEKFSRYLGGMVLESIIFSAICYVVFLIFKIPYALLVAVVVGIFNLIPTIGGYIGGAVGSIIIFTESADKVLVFIIIMLVLQQVEQITTYPIVVGKYLGLSSFYVLCAVIVGGGLFGFWGFLLGVPIFAFLYNLVEVVASNKTKCNTKAQTTS